MRIQAAMVDDLRPVRPLPPSRAFLSALAIIFLCVVATGTAVLGMNGWSALSMVQKIAVFATLAVSAILLALSMVHQMAPGSRHALSPTVLPIAVLAALMLVMGAVFRPEEEFEAYANGLQCMRNGLVYSIPAAFLFWMVLRRGAILLPKLMGASAGGLAGLTGFGVLEINCPNVNEYHVLSGHWGVIVVSSLASVALGAAAELSGRPRHSKPG